MTLLQPIWLVLIIPLALSLFVWRLPSRWLLGLRIVALVLIVLALCELSVLLPGQAGTVIVLADRSLSMPAGSESGQKELIDLMQAGMHAEDRLGVISFGETLAVEQAPQAGRFGGMTHEVGRDASNLGNALESALSLIPPDRPGRVVVLSDGRWTGRDPAVVASRAAARGVAVDYRLMQRPLANDVAIARLDTPARVTPGEVFLLTAWINVPSPQEVSFELRRGNKVLVAGKRAMESGLNRLVLRDRADEPGTQAYTLHVSGREDDPVPENNHARMLIGIDGHRPILHVSGARNSGLPRLLEGGGLKVKTLLPEDCDWSLDALSKYAAVIIENVPAQKIGTNGMETLSAWVRDSGAGLMVTGGRDSYGPGGYYLSPLEAIMPVSMELRQEHRKLAVAIVVALDRSGSMAAPVGGGKAKMDLANLGTVEVLNMLSAKDEFGVLAVDSAPHVVAELAPVTDKNRVKNDVLRIQSMGGGIFVDEALRKAAAMILPATPATKHIVLFSDAADSEQPGDYKKLLEKMSKAGITVSVIGLGKPTDPDADLLRDIAKRGNGRVFFTDKPEELPRLFAQDTFVVARNTFLDELVSVQMTAGLQALTGKQFGAPPQLGGYNLCYLRPGATLGTITTDEYKAPVAAAWQAGIGRVVCYTGEVDGKFTGPIAGWKDIGAYFTSLTRWTAGHKNQLPDNMLLTQEVKDGIAVIQLHLDPKRKTEPFTTTTPRVSILRALPGAAPTSQKAILNWTGPDVLSVEVPLEGSATMLATVDVPGQLPISLPPVCMPYSPEFKPSTEGGLSALQHLAGATAGKERVDLAEIWKEIPRVSRPVSLTPWLLVAAVVILLFEVLERRTGALTRVVGVMKAAVAARRMRPARAAAMPAASAGAAPKPAAPEKKPEEPKKDAPAPPPPKPAPALDQTDVLDAMKAARQRARGRTDR